MKVVVGLLPMLLLANACDHCPTQIHIALVRIIYSLSDKQGAGFSRSNKLKPPPLAPFRTRTTIY